jgi:hypothetical protein
MNTVNQMIEQKFWIRFELGLDPLNNSAYFDEMNDRASSIIKFVFSNDDEVHVVNRISFLKGSRLSELPAMSRYFKSKESMRNLTLETIPYEYDENDIEFLTNEFIVKTTFQDIRTSYLITALGNKDFRRKPRVRGNIYLLNVTKQILFHMYDDRGCDVYANNKEALLPLYHRNRKWILDYNRIYIDGLFGEGLAGYSESEDEKRLRQANNEAKMKETQINLFRINTHHIIHSLEIPTNESIPFEKETAQTGFSLRVQYKESDTTIYDLVKAEALALIDYQSELMSLYAKKYRGIYHGWKIERSN